MKAEVKLILPIVNKVYREWREGYGPVVITKNLSAKFARMMKSQYGVLLSIKDGSMYRIMYEIDEIEIVDEKKYMMFFFNRNTFKFLS
jgi:hypothetical protein